MKRHCGGRRRRAQRTYRLLVRLYPAAHRRAFGEPMVQTFGDHYRDAVERRGGSRLRFWAAVLADTGTSLLTEHAAEFRARRRSRRARWNRSKVRRRTGRVRRRLRYRPSIRRPARRIAVLVLLLALAGTGLGTGAATGHLGLSVLMTGLLVLAWLAFGIRLARRVPAGPRGNGPAPPG